MAAVKQYGWTIQFASKDIQKDRKIVMAAVKQDGWALKFASLELRGDCDVVLEAAEHNSSSLQHANLKGFPGTTQQSPPSFVTSFHAFTQSPPFLLSLGKSLMLFTMDYCSKH